MITILTEPSFSFWFQVKKKAKNFIKRYLLQREILPYSGHFGVVRSLIKGLEKNNQEYSYNPFRLSEHSTHIHVLANKKALRLAIRLKRKGKIKRLSAGPNIVISSADAGGVIASPEIDCYAVNSEWTKSFYLLDNPALEERIVIWPAGVDKDLWKTTKQETPKPVIVFYKKRPEHYIYEHCKTHALNMGYQVEELIYGSYSHPGFKELMTRAKAVVYFVEQESQGLALLEIWATNTPTFVWDPGVWMYKNTNYACSSAPYLSKMTGKTFKNLADFEVALGSELKDYEPETWVSENMTDAICANLFLERISYNRD